MILIVAVFLAGPAPAFAEEKARSSRPLNEKVVEFARDRRGQKVGDGSCLTLATAALRASGGKVFPFNRPDANYIWGDLVESPRDALPGDIVQFRDAEFKGKTWVTRRRWVSWHQNYPHHTAIVSDVAEKGQGDHGPPPERRRPRGGRRREEGRPGGDPPDGLAPGRGPGLDLPPRRRRSPPSRGRSPRFPVGHSPAH